MDRKLINKSLGTNNVSDNINIQYIVKNILFFSFINDLEVLTI